MNTQDAVKDLRALSNLINISVDQIENEMLSRGQTYPLLSEPYSAETEKPRMAPDILAAGSIIIAAAAQLIASVRIPVTSVLVTAIQYEVSSSLRVAIQAHVPEILREFGNKGLHVRDIAAHTKVDPSRLGRILRLLATNHIFTEISPDVFIHNKLSSILDTGKPLATILSNPVAKHDDTLGTVALFEQLIDLPMKASSYLSETLHDPRTKGADNTAFNRALNTNMVYFSWLELPENAYRHKRFGASMKGVQNTTPPDSLLKGFNWEILPPQSTVVDVGAGIGSMSLELARAFPHLKFVLQDTPATLANAMNFWSTELPEAINTGRVKLQAHDFFETQPVKHPSVFLMRMVLHDWSDDKAVNILRHLCAAAGPETQLVVIDNILSYACTEDSFVGDIPGAVVERLPPSPLLPNLGYAAVSSYLADLSMLNCHNGTERTLIQFKQILEDSGWKITNVHRSKEILSKITAVPA